MFEHLVDKLPSCTTPMSAVWHSLHCSFVQTIIIKKLFPLKRHFRRPLSDNDDLHSGRKENQNDKSINIDQCEHKKFWFNFRFDCSDVVVSLNTHWCVSRFFIATFSVANTAKLGYFEHSCRDLLKIGLLQMI